MKETTYEQLIAFIIALLFVDGLFLIMFLIGVLK
jgi:hypothetical protein